jgi:DNA-binding MarR family transcriptional regulator
MLKQPTVPRDSDCIGDVIDQSMDLTARFLADRADLSASAAFALIRVRHEGPMRLTVLATEEGTSQPAMTQLVQRLERQGLVTRLADPDDGRASLVGITPHGEELLDDRKRLRRERLATLFEALTPEDQYALRLSAQVALPILARLIENAELSPEPAAVQPERKVAG